ncbi:MAG: hypothetical protein HOC91_16390 [Nitrospinaceae bacterium]|jgi:hypothetical protein|nr:hypothetical protein [Nitrospinaceae bacterium]MBT3435067.1 hypothetical protein [Nitrospinaceae bacterium]MBT3821825.1 hypothetical protein [Nitrospinaceae bacterium]MBT4094626.1 hypothetical protein [Nitrospinaceae bacterium]MBT4432089.1 hypothetical protein [Nitrospinaceae bacterium]
MLDQNSFLVELTENCGAQILPDGRVKTNRSQLEKCAATRSASVSVSHSKNFEKNIHVPTITVRRVEKKGAKTETENLYFNYEEQGEDMITENPAAWGRIPIQIFG